jgi:hypothetical protein
VRPDRNPLRPDGDSKLPIFAFGKKIWSSITESRPDGLLNRLDGCKLEQKLLDTEEGPDGNPRHPDGWCFGLSGVRTVWHDVQTVGTMDRWASRRDDTSSERLAGNRFFLTFKQCRISGTLLNSGIPVKKHLYIQVILSNQNEANYKLTMPMIVRSSTRHGWKRLMTRAFWDDLLNLARKSFTIHVYIFFQGSSDLDGQAHLLFDQFLLMGPLRLRIQRMVLLSRLVDED